jgi:hypothetical protein
MKILRIRQRKRKVRNACQDDIKLHFNSLEWSLYAVRNGLRPSNVPTRQAASEKSVETRFYVLDCTKHQCTPYFWSPRSDRIWLTPFAVIPLRVPQQLRSGMSGTSRVLSSSEINTQTANCNVYRQGVRSEIQTSTRGNGFTRSMTASSPVLSPSSILPALRSIVPLSFPQRKIRCLSKFFIKSFYLLLKYVILRLVTAVSRGVSVPSDIICEGKSFWFPKP